MSQNFSYRIRELRLGDIPAVVELGHRHFTTETLPLLHQTWGETEVLNNYTSDPEFCLVAEREGRPIGFILGTLMTPDPARHTAQPYGWLLWIAVSERHRRHGIAAKLTDKLARRFKTAGAAFMLVNSAIENTPAVKLFQNNGFAGQTTHLYLSRPL